MLVLRQSGSYIQTEVSNLNLVTKTTEFSINDVLSVSPSSEQIIHTEVSNFNPVAKKTDFFERKYISVDKRMFNRFSCNL